jgi:hypothetical protein
MKAFFLLPAACAGLAVLGATVPLRSGEGDRQELRGVRLEVTWLVGNNLSYSPEEDLKLPVELVFTNDGRKGQRFNTTEYFFAGPSCDRRCCCRGDPARGAAGAAEQEGPAASA